MYFRSIVPALALLAPALASNVLDLTPANFDAEVLNSGKPALVEFFAPWCGHCKNLAPVYEELADSFATSKKNVLIAKVDADEHKSLGSKFGVQGFPTIKFFDGKSKEPEDYTGGRDLESFQNYITEKTKVRAKRAAKAPSEIKHLTDKTFEKAIGGAKGVFVAFTAPWCGHCKTLAPVWETLASDLVGDSETVSIAKVDAEAEKKVADTYGIKSYPTIKYFPKGSTTPVDYTGGRSIGDLISYVNEQAGTHRVPGGGLDLTAGTVAALDKLVQGVSGKTLDSVVADVQKAAADAKDAGVAYYIKVLNKIKENSGYVQKESSRLEGILAKGGLSRSKQDDLTRRLNVLKKFVAQPEADTISENMEAIKESVKSVREEL